MLKVYCHHLDLQHNVVYESNEEFHGNLLILLDKLFSLKPSHFKPATQSTENQYLKRYTFREEIDFETYDYSDGKVKLKRITIHGKAWEREQFALDYNTVLATAKTLNLEPREIHFKIRIPEHKVKFSQIDLAFTSRNYQTRSYVNLASHKEGCFVVPTWYVGARSDSGKRFSFYWASKQHPEAQPQDVDIEHQVYGTSEVKIFLSEIEKHGLEIAFFSRLQNTIQFKEDTTGKNKSRKPLADFWQNLVEEFPNVRTKKVKKNTTHRARINALKGKLYSTGIKYTTGIHLQAIREYLNDQGLLQSFVHDCLEIVQHNYSDKQFEQLVADW